jgi:hypothetical protein
MSLGDRYSRGGDGRLELLDRYWTNLGDRFGNYWRDRTGVSRHTLTQSLYLFAAWSSMQYVALTRDPAMLGIVALSVLALMGLTRSRGGLVEQIQLEALRLPRRTFVILRVWLLSLGMLSLTMAISDLWLTLQSGTPLPPEAGQSLLLGLALTALQSADYISRTNPSTPSTGLRRRA